jgi:iron(III) transport system substrate-binding protein
MGIARLRPAARLAMAVLVLTGAALAPAACGGSSDEGNNDGAGLDEVLAEVAGLSGDERRDRLSELAQEEGALSLYTSMANDRLAVVIGAFEDEYGIDVAVYRANSEAVVPRLLEEAEAGFRGADVVRVQGLGMVNLNNAGILGDYESPQREKLIDGAIFDGWTADSFSTFAVSWNTDLVPEADVPTSWEALADPKWAGQLAIEAGDVNWYAALREYWLEQGKSEEEADRLFEAIASNALVVSGHTLLGQLMAAGEFAIGPNYSFRVDVFREEGAPLAWEPAVEPLFPEPQGVGVVASAEHPAAALLFVDWLLGDGQAVLAEDTDVARRDLASAPDANRRVIDVAAVASEQEELTERYDQLLRLGREIEG